MEEVRVAAALIGLGDIGLAAHLPALLAEPRVTLAALADVDDGHVEQAAALAPGVRATTAVEDVLLDPTIDAVVIATPPWVTTKLACRALEAGKYVLAEKPPAPSLAEAAELAGLPEAQQRLQIGLTYRHHPSVDRLRELVRGGNLGSPLLILASVCDEVADPDGDPVNFARRRQSLEHYPPVISDGIHACDRLNYLLGTSPTTVQGWALRSDERYATANANGAVLEYDDGTVARLDVIWLYPVLPPSQFVVAGPRGCAVLDPPTFALSVAFADGTTETIAPPGGKTEICFERQLSRFVDHCLAGTPPVPGLDEALAALALAQRIAAAAGLMAEVPS